MMVIILTIIGTVLFSFIIALYTNRAIVAYIASLAIVHLIYFIQSELTDVAPEPFAPLANIILTFVVIGSAFIGHMLWVIYCLKTGKNVIDIDDLK
tara:strand:- start:85529 stop:85816 length:288 start_codon:yes stop_codon:yes gene_type:complete